MSKVSCCAHFLRSAAVRNRVFAHAHPKIHEIVRFDDEDAFKKRGTAFENEYVRRITQDQLNQLKKRIETEKKTAVKRALEKEREKLEQTLDKLSESEKSKR